MANRTRHSLQKQDARIEGPVLKRCSVLSIFALVFAVAGATSCRERIAAGSELPPPEADQRPSGAGPELPRVAVELPDAPTTKCARVVLAGGDLQDLINAAKPGDVIALPPGAVFKGTLNLPDKSGDEWITIRTGAADGAFPPAHARVNPSNAALMPVLESSSGPAISAAAGAHHYRFIGIEIRPAAGAFLYNLIELGSNETSVEDLPHHIIFERCYVHGDPQVGGRRGIALNSRNTAVVDSYFSDFKEQGGDSQAIAGWNGLGPFAIVNNYLEGAAENLLFGGADPTVKNLVPADIEIRRNTFAKPLSWKIGDPSYGGKPWTGKNLLELKNAHRVLIDGNIFEYNWAHAQIGLADLFTPRNQYAGSSWSMVQDV